MMLAASLCLAALFSFGTAKAPSQAPGQVPGMWHATLDVTSGDAGVGASAAAPVGGEVILVGGIKRG